MKKPKVDQRVTLLLDKEMQEYLEGNAINMGLTMSAYVRSILKQFIRSENDKIQQTAE